MVVKLDAHLLNKLSDLGNKNYNNDSLSVCVSLSFLLTSFCGTSFPLR